MKAEITLDKHWNEYTATVTFDGHVPISDAGHKTFHDARLALADMVANWKPSQFTQTLADDNGND